MRRRRMTTIVGLAIVLLLLTLVALVWLRPGGEPGGRPVIALSLDKTWWNRVGLSRWTYRRAIWRAGGFPVIVDFDDAGVEEVDRALIAELLAGVHGLVLSGGGDVDPALYGGDVATGLAVNPARDRFELALLEEAERRRLPILAICRGAQLLNVVRGGTLRNLRGDPTLARRHRSLRSHRVDLEPGSRLAEALGTLEIGRVVSWHGQAVERPGQGVRVVGRAADGVVEAIEVVDEDSAWIVGVQWHPEVARRQALQTRLFERFVAAAERVRSGS